MSALRTMAAALGGKVMNGRKGPYILCPGPGHSANDHSLSVTLSATDPDGFIVNSFSARDDWRVCRDHVRARIGHAWRAGHARRERRPPPVDHSARAVALWNASNDPTQLVRDYHALRGLTLPDDVAGRVVRFHPRCPWRGDGGTEYRPAMILAFRSITTDQLTAVHRVALAPDATKIGRRMLGTVGFAAIKVDDDTDIELGLAIGEGYETALAGRMLGFRPVWALGSAGAIAAMPVLSGIAALTILAETDDTGANAGAVAACCRRWFAASREAIIATPKIIGDMNTVLMP